MAKAFPWKEFLRTHPILPAGRAGEDLDDVLQESASAEHTFAQDEVIVRQGATGDSVFVLGTGSAEAILEASEGTEVPLALMQPGEIFGEMGVLEGRPRSATVRAREPSIVLEIRGSHFRALMRAHPDLEFRLLVSMSVRLRNTNEKLEDFRSELEQRVERRTRELATLNRKLEASNARLRQLDRLKSDFVSDVSHELRAPLTSIYGYVDYLLEGLGGELNAVQRDSLNRVHLNTRRLIRLIDDLLDLARIEAGRAELHVTALPLLAVAAEVIDELRPLALDKHIDLALEPTSAEVWVRADRDKLHQVLLNLAHNAVKFTPPGGTVRVAATVVGDGTVATAVRDTGEGIPAEELAHIFDKFYQVDASGGQGRGSGLGLTITQKLVELHGGTIRVASAPGQGTEFSFTLPAAARRP